MGTLFSLERFDRPEYLWLALLVVMVWWLSRRSLAGLGPIRSRLCIVTRCCVILLLVLAMAGTHKIRKNDDLSVLFLLDVSKSVPTEARRKAEKFILAASRDMRPNDRAAVLTFDGQTNIEQLPSHPGPEGGIHVAVPFPDGQRPDQTNLAQGMRMAAACAPDSTNNRVVILSDGNQNVGDALDEAKAASANDMTIDVVPLEHQQGAEVMFDQLRAPPYANLHEQITLRALIRSSRATRGKLVIYQRIGTKEEAIDLDPQSDAVGKVVRLNAGKNAFTVRLPIKVQRSHEFRGEIIPLDPTADINRENNVAVAFTNVEGPKTVLMIGKDEDREEDDLLVRALREENIRVSWAPADTVNLSTTVLQDYAAIILSNVGAYFFSSQQQQALATYVRDLGGGLIMIGGDDSFGAGGWQGSVVEAVMPVRFDVDAVRQIPRGALAIVMHSCEMPQGNKWGIETAVAALKTLSRLDYFGVVGWGLSGFHWEVKMQAATNKAAIIQQLRKMQNADMFDFQTPMSMAYKALMSRKDAAQRHMIIISDGDPARPSFGLLNRMVGNRVTCSTVAIFPHSGQEIGTLKWIAKVTHGRYYFLNKPGDEKRLPKIFTKEARVVRRPLIRDEIFVPKISPTLSDIMVGINGPFPELKGYVVTTPRQVADVEIPLKTKRGDPLLAHWLCGAGRAVVFTSGQWKHWGSDWPQWPSFSKFWAQTVRWCMEQGTVANYDVSTVVQGDQAHVTIETMDDSADGADFRPFGGRVIKPDGTAANLPIVQTGPGRYEATFKMTQKGAWLVYAAAPGTKRQQPVVIRTGVAVPYSPEYRDRSANEALLREVVEETEGRVLSPRVKGKTVFAHNLPETISRTPIWDMLLKLAVLVFLLDVAFRRIAIDPVKVLARSRNYIASLAGRFGAGRRAEATLSDLRSVRQRARAEQAQRVAGSVGDHAHRADRSGSRTPSVPTAGGPDAARKFDAGDAVKKPAQDLAEAMGGHQSQPSTSPKPKPKKQAGPQESTTARLLKAKRRVREQDGEDKRDE